VCSSDLAKHSKRIRNSAVRTSAVHNEDLELLNAKKPDEYLDRDLIRAEGEGMITTDLPSTQVPPLPMRELFRSHLDAQARAFMQVQLPAIRRALTQTFEAHPIATLGVVVAAGAVGALLIRPIFSDSRA